MFSISIFYTRKVLENMEELKTDNDNSNLPKSNFRKKVLGVFALAIAICICLICLQSRMSNLENRQEAPEKMTTVQDCDHLMDKILRINFDFVLDSGIHSTQEEPCQQFMNIGNLRIECCSETKPRSKRGWNSDPDFEPANKPFNIGGIEDYYYDDSDQNKIWDQNDRLRPINLGSPVEHNENHYYDDDNQRDFTDRRRPVNFGSPSPDPVEHKEHTMKFTINQDKSPAKSPTLLLPCVSNQNKVELTLHESGLIKIKLNDEVQDFNGYENPKNLNLDIKNIAFGTIKNIHVSHVTQ